MVQFRGGSRWLALAAMDSRESVVGSCPGAEPSSLTSLTVKNYGARPVLGAAGSWGQILQQSVLGAEAGTTAETKPFWRPFVLGL